MGLEKIKSNSVECPLNDTTYHNLNSIITIIDKAPQSNSKILSPNFNKADFKNIN